MEGLSPEKIYIGPIIEEFEKKKAILPARVAERIEGFIAALNVEDIDLPALRIKCFSGIPDDIAAIRSVCWRLILGLLPTKRAVWPEVLKGMRSTYSEFVNDFLINGGSTQSPKKDASAPAKPTPVVEDHPLSKSTNSAWAELYKDFELWETVEKDTKRTRAEMDFFQKPTNRTDMMKYVHHKFRGIMRKQHGAAPTIEPTNETHTDVLQRLLYIYARLNVGISYVQGMNELLAPIYYCFSQDTNPAFAAGAEADAFWCFTNLMAEIKESFCRSLDNAEYGIKSRVAKLHALLRRVDEDLRTHFEKQSVSPMYYGMRWLMLFFTQEFELGEVETLWDSLLSHENKMEFLDYLCVAVIISRKERLLDGEFADILDILRRIDDVNIFKMLADANKLHQEFAYSKPKLGGSPPQAEQVKRGHTDSEDDL
jgi:hypothetical protein